MSRVSFQRWKILEWDENPWTKTRGPWATSLTWENSSINKHIIFIKRRIRNHYFLYNNLLFFHLKIHESPSPKDALCQDWLKLAQCLWRREFFKFVNVFCYLVFISPWERAGSFIWTNLSPLLPRMLCAKFGWNWPSGSGEEDFLISSMYFHHFVIISPLKGRDPSFEQTWIPFTQEYFVPNLVEIDPVVLEKKMKMSKVYRQTDRRTDRRRTKGNQESSLKLKTNQPTNQPNKKAATW